MELIQNHFSHTDEGIDKLCNELKRWGKWVAVFEPSTNDKTESGGDNSESNGLHEEYEWTFYVVARTKDNNDAEVNGSEITKNNIDDTNSIYLRIGEHKDSTTHKFTITQHCKNQKEVTESASSTSNENKYYYRIEMYENSLIFYWNNPSNTTSTTSYSFSGKEHAIVVTKGRTIKGEESQIMFFKKDNSANGTFTLACYDKDTNNIEAKSIYLIGSGSSLTNIDQAQFNVYIPLCNTTSTYYAPEILLSIMTNSSSLQFGTTTINDKNYRVSGYFTVLDENDYKLPKIEEEKEEESE